MRNEDFPHPAAVAHAHRMPATVPRIEVADDAHSSSVRRPDGEAHAVHPIDIPHAHRVRAEEGEGAQVRTFAEVVEVGVADQRAEGVRVGVGSGRAVVPANVQAIVEAVLAPRHLRFPKARGVALLQRDDCTLRRRLALAVRSDQLHGGGLRQHRANPQCTGSVGVQAECGKRVAVACMDEGVNVGRGKQGGLLRWLRQQTPKPIFNSSNQRRYAAEVRSAALCTSPPEIGSRFGVCDSSTGRS